MAKYEITSKRKAYYTQIDNMLMMELNVYQYMLLSQYYRICSLPNGKTTLADKPLAEICGMSPNKLKSTRKELETLGYITVTEQYRETGDGKREQLPYLVTVIDVQDKNFGYWEHRNIVTGVPSDDTGVSHVVGEGITSDDTPLSHEMLPNKNKENNTDNNSLSSTDDALENDSIDSSSKPSELGSESSQLDDSQKSGQADNSDDESAVAKNATPQDRKPKKLTNRQKYGDELFDGIREEICKHLKFPVAHRDCTASQNRVVNKLRDTFLSEKFQLGDAKEYMERLDKYYAVNNRKVEQYSYAKSDMLAKYATIRQQRNAKPIDMQSEQSTPDFIADDVQIGIPDDLGHVLSADERSLQMKEAFKARMKAESEAQHGNE